MMNVRFYFSITQAYFFPCVYLFFSSFCSWCNMVLVHQHKHAFLILLKTTHVPMVVFKHCECYIEIL